MPIFVFAVLLIPSFHVLSDSFYVSLNLMAVPTVRILIKFVTTAPFSCTSSVRLDNLPAVICFFLKKIWDTPAVPRQKSDYHLLPSPFNFVLRLYLRYLGWLRCYYRRSDLWRTLSLNLFRFRSNGYETYINFKNICSNRSAIILNNSIWLALNIFIRSLSLSGPHLRPVKNFAYLA